MATDSDRAFLALANLPAAWRAQSRRRPKITQQTAHNSSLIAANDVQPEDIQGPFEVRMRADAPPGLEFWDRPPWIYGQSIGRNAGDNARLEFTHRTDRKDGRSRTSVGNTPSWPGTRTVGRVSPKRRNAVLTGARVRYRPKLAEVKTSASHQYTVNVWERQ
jgi:hypothetical protein